MLSDNGSSDAGEFVCVSPVSGDGGLSDNTSVTGGSAGGVAFSGSGACGVSGDSGVDSSSVTGAGAFVSGAASSDGGDAVGSSAGATGSDDESMVILFL